jgi:hypothetical protein
MPQPAPVRLHIHHLVSRLEGCRARFELETGAVGVGGDYVEAVPNSVPAVVGTSESELLPLRPFMQRGRASEVSYNQSVCLTDFSPTAKATKHDMLRVKK